MHRAFLKVAAFGLTVVGVFMYVGYVVTSVSGRTGEIKVVEGISPEAGEAIFWGRGRCHTCHSIGTQGSAIRCPNLGVSGEFTQPIYLRAATRREGYINVQYMVESVYNPSAFVVKGFPDKVMPNIKKPPISLTDEDIQAVLVYLISLSTDGEVDGKIMNAIGREQQPYKTGKVQVAEAVKELKIPPGDPEEGRLVFQEMKCYQCHKVKGEEFPVSEQDVGGVGPDLTDIGSIQASSYLFESILSPNAVVVRGEGYTDENGESKMPEYHDVMKMRELLDLVAYLSTLKPEEK